MLLGVGSGCWVFVFVVRREKGKAGRVDVVGSTLNGVKLYPYPYPGVLAGVLAGRRRSGASLPSRPNALVHPTLLNSASGSTSVLRYVAGPCGAMRYVVGVSRREV